MTVLCPCTHFLIYPEKVSSNVISREKPSLTTRARTPCSMHESHSVAVACLAQLCASPAPEFLQAESLPCSPLCLSLGHRCPAQRTCWIERQNRGPRGHLHLPSARPLGLDAATLSLLPTDLWPHDFKVAMSINNILFLATTKVWCEKSLLIFLVWLQLNDCCLCSQYK